jgi:hypothetical protein
MGQPLLQGPWIDIKPGFPLAAGFPPKGIKFWQAFTIF